MKVSKYVSKYGVGLASPEILMRRKAIISVFSQLTKDAMTETMSSIEDDEPVSFYEALLDSNGKWNEICKTCKTLKIFQNVDLPDNLYLKTMKETIPDVFEADTLLRDIANELFPNEN